MKAMIRREFNAPAGLHSQEVDWCVGQACGRGMEFNRFAKIHIVCTNCRRDSSMTLLSFFIFSKAMNKIL